MSLEFTVVCGESGRKQIGEAKNDEDGEGGGYSRKGVDIVEGVGVEEGDDGGVVSLSQEDSIEG